MLTLYVLRATGIEFQPDYALILQQKFVHIQIQARSLSDFGRVTYENIKIGLFLSEFSLNMSNIRLKSEQKQSQIEWFLATVPKVRQTPSFFIIKVGICKRTMWANHNGKMEVIMRVLCIFVRKNTLGDFLHSMEDFSSY